MTNSLIITDLNVKCDMSLEYYEENLSELFYGSLKLLNERKSICKFQHRKCAGPPRPMMFSGWPYIKFLLMIYNNSKIIL